MKTTLMEEDVVLHNPLSNGTALNDVTLNAAITAIGSAETVLLITSGIWTLALDVIVPDNITLLVPRGSSISVNATKTLTITRPNSVTAGNYTIFTGAGDVALVGNRLVGWWGALGNGVNDDTSEIQKALDTLETDGDSLEFSATGVTKYYRILSTLTLPATNRITVFGAGIGATQIRQETSGQDGIASNAVATNDVTLRDFWLDGGALSGRYGLVWGTTSAGANRSQLHNLRISAWGTAGIATVSSIIVSVLRCNFNSNKDGILALAGGVSDPNAWSVVSSIFEANTDHAMRLLTSFGWNITGNTIEANLLGGLRLDAIQGFSITGNYFELNFTASGGGAYFDIDLGDTGTSNGVSVTGNLFSGASTYNEDSRPIRLELVSGLVLSGNTIGSGSRFVQFESGSLISDAYIGANAFNNGSLSRLDTGEGSYISRPSTLFNAALRNIITQITSTDDVPWDSIVRKGMLTLDLDNYTTAVTNGTVARFGVALQMDTSTTANSDALARIAAPGFIVGLVHTSTDYAKDCILTFVMSSILTTTNGTAWLMLTNGTTAANPTNDTFGFRLDDDALKGITHNGSVLTVVDLLVTLTDNIVYVLQVHQEGSVVRFYVNGVEEGSTTVVPGGNNTANIVFAVDNGADSATQRLIVLETQFRVTQ